MAINWNVEKYKATYIAELIDKKTIKVPHYQRGQVWKKEQKETLIDSIKKGYPFGSILLFEMEDKTYQLIDGLQRVSTIYEYLHNPASFFNKSDIKKESIDQIYKLLNLKGNEEKVKDQLLNVIQEWVTEKHKTMEDVKNMQFIECARYIDKKFSLETSDNTFKVTEILSSDLSAFRDNCDLLTSIEIPVIIYEGDSDNLSEVFNRINSKGTTLSKYQILSATWSDDEYKLESEELDPIIDYVDRFYLSISDVHFGIEGYDRNSVIETRRLNLYQIVYGFGKLLSNKFPYLFKQSKNEQIDSCGFNLINSCIGNKNSKMSKLPKIINSTFKNDIEFSEFLVNIIDTIDIVYRKLKPYLEFKLNKRNSKIEIYHSEFQICSMIANYFNAKYSTYKYDDNNNIINREINTIEINDNFDTFQKGFEKNAFKKYLIDILDDNWKGSGDSKLDRIAVDTHYYTDDITIDMMESSLDHWFEDYLTNHHEYKNVQNPKAPEKLLLSIIYGHSFTAVEQNDEINYDIEHLAPKKRMKKLLAPFNNGDNEEKLPISSFGNLCLLKEGVNRRKKDKTLYEDDLYLKSLNNKNIDMNEIEEKFSFTKKEDLDWINIKYTNFNNLKNNYLKFVRDRFKKQKEHILNNLYHEDYLDYEYYTGYDSTNHIKISSINQTTLSSTIAKPTAIVQKKEEINYETIINKLNGWDKDIFNLINDLNKEYFVLSDLYEHKDELQKLHPSNSVVESRIRRTLQKLRDYGLIEFVSRGKYRKLW